MTLPLHSRREFLQTAAGAALAAGVLGPGAIDALARSQRATKPLRILFLGGTGFLGPSMVRHALVRGHDLTIFNRGKSRTDLFPEVKRLVGDRINDLSALEEGEWDVCIDTSSSVPDWTKRTAELLKGRVGQYIFTSSVSVYSQRIPGMGVEGPKSELPDTVTMSVRTPREITGENYGPLKYKCELVNSEIMGDKALNIRPGLIVGPEDYSDRFTYWPARADRGGKMMCPGSGDDFVQHIDVRDLAEWIISCCERRVTGTYNAVTKPSTRTMRDVCETCIRVADAGTEAVWVPTATLSEYGVSMWQDMPTWIPPEFEGFEGVGALGIDGALREGLKFRTLETTVRDTLAWWRGLPAERTAQIRTGISPERERAVLEALGELEPDSTP